MLLYIHTKFEPQEVLSLKQQLLGKYQLVIGEEIAPDERKQAFLKADVCFGNVPLEWAAETTQLKWLQLHSAGLDPYQQLSNHQFFITNLKGFFGQSVAETAVAGILAMYRGVAPLAQFQQQKKWVGTPWRAQLHLLNQAKVLIVGGGSIGLKVQQLVSGFDCAVTILTSKTIAQLDECLPLADIVVATLPETPETIHLFNKTRLELLKASALFVNVGRGSAVDENALIDLLANNKLYGAVLDVTEIEPLPENNPLWHLPNVLLTQHTSGGWAEENASKVSFFIENLTRFESNQPLVNIVDLVKGY
jgi:phosphoglycerate dehydrogenase-like enzyme